MPSRKKASAKPKSKKKATRKKASARKSKPKTLEEAAEANPDDPAAQAALRRKAKKPNPKRSARARKAKPDDFQPNGRFAKGNQCGYRIRKGEVLNPFGNRSGSGRTRILSDRLEAWMNTPAADVRFIADFAESALGMDKKQLKSLTVADIVGLNQVLQTVVGGEAAFMRELFNRIEGRVVEHIAAKVDGSMGISEAMAMIAAQRDANTEDEA